MKVGECEGEWVCKTEAGYRYVIDGGCDSESERKSGCKGVRVSDLVREWE